MPSLRDIKRRIRSVKNIAQITKAMEVVSMTKMRRSQSFALAARPYALASLDMLKNLVARTPANHLPALLHEREIKTILLVIVTADKGLVGGFNENVLRKAAAFMARREAEHVNYKVLTVGRKAKEFVERRGIKTEHSFFGYGDFVRFSDTKPVSDFILHGFEKGNWDAVTIIYTHFRTTLRQETKERKLLPTRQEFLEDIVAEIIPESGRFSELRNKNSAGMLVGLGAETKYHYEYLFEPSPESVIAELAGGLLRVALHHVMLESNASEHSARMVTMKNASDNASDLQDRLALESNKIRQAGITSELSEIIAGAEALQ
jgi:F-type H+-transporting ATPase subunit gamma